MKKFMDKDFLLETETAKHIFHSFAENEPICDYHCHLNPKEIYENKQPKSIAELWLSGDHYKWRIMRAVGADENLVTGNGDEKEKFRVFAKALQLSVGNPLYHWAHLELQRYFDIDTPLSEKTADEIFDRANATIENGDFRPQTLIKKSNVKYICTTDDPTNDLRYHELLSCEENNYSGAKILPTFRPDKALNIAQKGFAEYVSLLENVSETKINSVGDLITALYKRAKFFAKHGCRVSDHSFGKVPFLKADESDVNEVFLMAMRGETPNETQSEIYMTYVFTALMKKYRSLDWGCEIHIGALRNNNSRMFEKLGVDTGFDTMQDGNVAEKLNLLLDSVEKTDELPKTVLFDLDNKDDLILAATIGNFQHSAMPFKMQYGPAWWFLDTKDGMTRQLKTLASVGVLGGFIGMETDSRSFTSYARHEYFRRIFCNLLGSWIENGEVFYDESVIKELVSGVCYKNAVGYFGFDEV